MHIIVLDGVTGTDGFGTSDLPDPVFLQACVLGVCFLLVALVVCAVIVMLAIAVVVACVWFSVSY